MKTFQRTVSMGAALVAMAKAACLLERAYDCINFAEM